MRIPSNAVQARNIQCRVADLQFVVGQDEEGHWVAMEAKGDGGGLFVNREAAVKYAESETGRRSAVLIFAKVPALGSSIELRHSRYPWRHDSKFRRVSLDHSETFVFCFRSDGFRLAPTFPWFLCEVN